MRKYLLAILILVCRKTHAQTPVQQFWLQNQSPVATDTLTWDVGPWNRQIDNGSATLQLTAPLWTQNGGKTNTKFISCKNVVFGGNPGVGAAGMVTLGAAVSNVRSISFYPAASGDFTITGQSIQTSCADSLPVFVSAGLSPAIISVLNGTNSLNKNGSGSLVLMGANTYSGATQINNGVLQIGNGGNTLASINTASAVNVAAGASLFWDVVNGSRTFPNPITGAGALSVNVAGNMSFNGGGDGTLSNVNNASNSYAGGTTLLGGFISANTAVLGTGAITMKGGGLCFGTTGTWSSNAIFVQNGSSGYLRAFTNQTGTVAVPVSGTGTLNFTDNGAIILTASNPFNGNIVMGSGNLSVNGTGVLGSGNFLGSISNLNGKVFTWNATTPQIFNGALIGTGDVVFNTGTVTTLSGGSNITAGTYYLNAGATNGMVIQNVTAGTYLFNNFTFLQNNINNAQIILNVSGGNLTVSGLMEMGTATTTGGGANGDTLNITGGSITATTFWCYKWSRNYINITNGSLIANTLHVGWVDTGPFALFTINSGGVFRFDALQIDAIRNNSINLNGGTLIPCPIPANTFGSVTVQANGGTIDNNSASIDIAQVITGSGVLTFKGSGVTTLSATNLYTGGSVINAGTARANSLAAFGTGTITVNAGATLDKNGFLLTNIVVNNGGTVIP
ncbi:autotransporter-associated beta strand repeat-containing protein [Taibaiella soli]|nr:autotransporter-associated beta strand repeat-containing protein [Taibaiella soli]